MKYRLTVKGQVALATALLLVVFAAGSLGRLSGAGPAAAEPAAPIPAPAPSAPAEASASVAPAAPIEDSTTGDSASAAPTAMTSKEAAAAVYFDPDKWEINAREIQKITEVAERLKADPNVKVIVEGNINSVAGHQDTAFGKDLSLKRAQVVVQVLMGKGIDEARIVVKSNGSSKPVTDQAAEAWMNRRTDLYLE